MNVPFLDIKSQNDSIRDELRVAIQPMIDQAQFVLGPGVENFEAEFSEYVGARECVGVNNGTSALHMALAASNIGHGDEVITTPHTWISTSWAISYVGAIPVFVDIDPKTYNIDPELVQKAITEHTKAILPVHLYGQGADVVTLRRIADENNLIMIEDAAQAHGAMANGTRLGTFGDSSCFSFYPGKNLGAFGEAGAVVTNDEQVAERIRRLRDHAQLGRHNHVEIGYNTRMDGIQGAVLSVKLRHLDRWNESRRNHASLYKELLVDQKSLTLPSVATEESHVWHLFVVLVQKHQRDAIRQHLQERGISTGVHYPTPVPMQPAYAHLGYQTGDFPIAEDVMSRCISLPMFPDMTNEQIVAVANALREIL